MSNKVIVIGGGTAGLMAASQAAKQGAQVTVLEKNTKLGRKLVMTGNGRCNVTNNRPQEEIIKHIPGNGHFLYSAFSQFNQYDIMNFFQERGVALKEEDHGRMFPTTDSARTILNTFIEEMKKYNVDIRTNQEVDKLLLDEEKVYGVRLSDGSELLADAVIISTGGKAVPRTGSTGDGYRFAKQAGHTITKLYPTEVPITSSEIFIENKSLRGLSMRDIGLSVLNKKGKTVVSHQMDMIFTHFGISGPAALRCSMFVHQTMDRDKTDQVTMALDALPKKSRHQVIHELKALAQENPDKNLINALAGYLPNRYLEFGLDYCLFDPSRRAKSLTDAEFGKLADYIKDFRFQVNGTQSLEKAFVTGGGVNTKEINPKTMASKLRNGLYFCGEVLDYNGYTGGYNITGAFVTGHSAGYHAAHAIQ